MHSAIHLKKSFWQRRTEWTWCFVSRQDWTFLSFLFIIYSLHYFSFIYQKEKTTIMKEWKVRCSRNDNISFCTSIQRPLCWCGRPIMPLITRLARVEDQTKGHYLEYSGPPDLRHASKNVVSKGIWLGRCEATGINQLKETFLAEEDYFIMISLEEWCRFPQLERWKFITNQ